MPQFTIDQIKAFAPDASSLSSANGLARASDWLVLEHSSDGNALWGEIKGSGKTPYQARIDMSEPAFKCSCPSRKFPCKHGLALLIVYAASASAFSEAPAPDWVSEWLDGRHARANRPIGEQKAAAIESLSDLEREEHNLKEAKKLAKSQAAKADKAQIGVAQCNLFLQDVLRTGLSQLAHNGGGFEAISAQLVDAQLPGLARMLRALADCQHSGKGWETRMLEGIGRLSLILAAHGRRSMLPVALQADLDQALGYTLAQDEVLSGSSLQDDWWVLGHALQDDAQVSTRRTWLMGRQSRRIALVLNFAVGNQPLAPAWPVGICYRAELAFYPGAAPQRVLIKGVVQRLDIEPTGFGQVAACTHLKEALDGYASALAALPWLARWPVLVSDVTLRWDVQAQTGSIVDASLLSIPVNTGLTKADWVWDWLAVTGGRPCTVAGEWDGASFKPLTMWFEGAALEMLQGLAH
jgi:SWIM zinc finger